MGGVGECLRIRACVLLSCLVFLSNCAVDSSTVRRTDLIRTTTVSSTTKELPEIKLASGAVAHVGGIRRACTTSRHEYAQVADQVVSHPKTGNLVLAGLCLAGGPTLLGVSSLVKAEGLRELLPALGVGLLIGAAVNIGFAIFSTDSYERTVPLEETAFEDETKCDDSELWVQGGVEWQLTLGKDRRKGTTGNDGRLALYPVMFDLLVENGTDEALLGKMLGGGNVPFELRMGDAAALSVHLLRTSVTEQTWERWGARLAGTLAPTRLLRFDACGVVTSSAREKLECLSNPAPHAARLLSFEGELAPSIEGYFGSLTEVVVDRSQPFAYLLLLPAENADWFARVVEVETGAVIAEGYSLGKRQLLSGTFPRPGAYAIVHAAKQGGGFSSVLTLGQGARR